MPKAQGLQQGEKPVYSMSSVGGCPRAVVALRLGYDRVEPPDFMQVAAREGERQESWVANDLKEHRWETTPPEYCETCGRHGRHVELESSAFRLVGHMDRTAIPAGVFSDGHRRLVEIKSLGRFRAQALVRALLQDRFREQFPGYAMQVSCYAYASGLPILYAVKNRDTGKLETFQIAAPYDIEEIIDHVLELEIAARKDALPPCRYKRGDFERTLCPVKYLCAGADEPEALPEMPSEDELVLAAESWRVCKAVMEERKRELDSAVAVLTRAVKASGQRVFNTNGLKVTYIASGTTVSYPKTRLEALVPQELLVQVREEKPRAEYVKVEEA